MEKWIGITNGIERSGALKKKELIEESFEKWADGLSNDSAGYSLLMNTFHRLYTMYEPLYLSDDLGNELLNSIELFDLLDDVQSRFYTMLDSSDQYKKSLSVDTNRKNFLNLIHTIDRRIMASPA
jgi:hypothetical protein